MAEMMLTLVDGLHFRGVTPSGQPVEVDSRIGDETPLVAPSPMEYVLVAIGACTAMDAISILRKMREDVQSYDVRLTSERAPDHPKVYTRVVVTHAFRGAELSEANVHRAIQLAITRYCPVFAMLYPSVDIRERYEIASAEGTVVASGEVEPAAEESPG